MSDIYLEDDHAEIEEDLKPAPVGVEELLLRVRELIDLARSMPMSASVLVNREELLELLDDALDGLPEELRHARWLLKEREEFLIKHKEMLVRSVIVLLKQHHEWLKNAK